MSPSAAAERPRTSTSRPRVAQRMRALVDAIEAGAFGDVTGILHIGIGGSVLGPGAAGRRARPRTRRARRPVPVEHRWRRRSTKRWSRSIRRRRWSSSRRRPSRRSKRWPTSSGALDWLRDGGVADPYGRCIAVTAQPEEAIEAGIDETRILPFGEGVGGRYSLWSSVGCRLRRWRWAGMRSRSCSKARRKWTAISASPSRAANVPLLAAFADRLYVESAAARRARVFAYDERLRLLPFYLQQLEMELNGKSVTADGEPVDRPTAPITWGGVGTDAQHAVFQLLHQGTVLVPGRIPRGPSRPRTRRTRSIIACCCSMPSRRARR